MNTWKSAGHIFWKTITGSSHSTTAVFDVISTQAPICLNVKWRIYLLKNRIQVPGVDYSSGSEGYDYGYDFAVQADPSVKSQDAGGDGHHLPSPDVCDDECCLGCAGEFIDPLHSALQRGVSQGPGEGHHE